MKYFIDCEEFRDIRSIDGADPKVFIAKVTVCNKNTNTLKL